MNTKLKLVIALSAISTIAAAGAVKALDLASSTLVNPAPLYADGVTSSGGLTKIDNDIWVSDHLQGFCRIKPSKVYGQAGTIDTTTCVTNAVSPGQATYDTVNKVVYVPDNSSKSTGVYVFSYNSTTKKLSTRPTVITGSGATSFSRLRVTATAMDKAGNLYVGALKSGDIFKITNPSGARPTVTKVGQTSDNRGVVSFAIAKSLNAGATAFVASRQDLYIAEGGGVTMINNISTCARAQCVATAVTTDATTPGGIASDGEKVYISDITGTVVEYDILSDTSVVGDTAPLRLPTAILIDLGTSSSASDDRLFVADDPTDGNGVAKGHVYWEFEQPQSTTTATASTTTN